jgi:hypothetical protein
MTFNADIQMAVSLTDGSLAALFCYVKMRGKIESANELHTFIEIHRKNT